MPNRRGEIDPGTDVETAHPWEPGRFSGAEPQERRGAPGSRGVGEPARPRQEHDLEKEVTGVNPLPAIDPSMPFMKPGDQGG